MGIPIVVVALLSLGGTVSGQTSPKPPIVTCDEISLVHPGTGASYKGAIHNSDYRFSAAIPADLTGWGAAPGAPFHGFTIFLDGKTKFGSCIDFQIGTESGYGEPDEYGQTQLPVRRIRIGNRFGLQTSRFGIIDGVSIENTIVVLVLERNGYRNQASFTLITPKHDLPRTSVVFRRFVNSFTFR